MTLLYCLHLRACVCECVSVCSCHCLHQNRRRAAAALPSSDTSVEALGRSCRQKLPAKPHHSQFASVHVKHFRFPLQKFRLWLLLNAPYKHQMPVTMTAAQLSETACWHLLVLIILHFKLSLSFSLFRSVSLHASFSCVLS